MENKTVEQLEKELQDSQEALVKANELNESLSIEVDDLKKEVARLIETPDEQESENGVGKTFTHEGKSYQVLVPAARVPGMGKLSALDILTSKEAQAALVKSGSGVIKAVN